MAVSKRWQAARSKRFDRNNPLHDRTIQQIDDWIDGNVLDLGSARTALKAVARALKAQQHEIERLKERINGAE